MWGLILNRLERATASSEAAVVGQAADVSSSSTDQYQEQDQVEFFAGSKASGHAAVVGPISGGDLQIEQKAAIWREAMRAQTICLNSKGTFPERADHRRFNQFGDFVWQHVGAVVDIRLQRNTIGP